MRRGIGSWLFLIVLMSGIVGGLGFYKYTEIAAGIAAGQSRAEPSEAVAVARVATAEWTPTTRAIGTVVARQQLELRNEIAGLVSERGFSSGDTVEKGQLLIQLDDRQEKASLAAAEAEARLARANLGRREALRNSPAFSDQEFDKTREEFAAASARVESLKVVIERKRIVAPFKARVGITDWQPGAYLEAGTLIVRLQGVEDDVYIDFALPQESAALLHPGDEVSVTSPALPNGPRPVKIVAEDDSVDPANRAVRFRALGRGLGAVLRPGAFVDVIANTAAPGRRLVVPLTAVRRSPEGQHVFVIETKDGQSRARQRRIETGAVIDGNIVVTKGLQEGDLVAAAGSFKLRDGLLVPPAPQADALGPAAMN
jgi:membrane fusion protein (multidrug efflux system)